jgi:hypothetical protein
MDGWGLISLVSGAWHPFFLRSPLDSVLIRFSLCFSCRILFCHIDYLSHYFWVIKSSQKKRLILGLYGAIWIPDFEE